MTNPSLKSNWAAVKRGENFNKLGSRPEQWGYHGGCEYVYHEVECDLCDTKINYRYPLKHNHSDDILRIGSECIKNYYEAYQPNGLDIMLELAYGSRAEARAKVVGEKLTEFAKNHEDIVLFLKSRDSRRRDLRKITYFKPVVGSTTGEMIPVTCSTSKFRAFLKTRGYLRDEEILGIMVSVDRWISESLSIKVA